MVKKIINYIIELLRPVVRKIVGWNEIEEEFTTMRHILDNYMDITEFPKAKGLLRKCQLADAELLRIVHEVLQKHNIQYWLGYGTLLGAVRHKGFIPWDDDLDICMTRENYNKAMEILPEELKKFSISVNKPNPQRIAISIWNAGLILDIFPADNVDADSIKGIDDLRNRTVEYRKYYVKHRNDSTQSLNAAKERIIGRENPDNPIWYQNVEFHADRCIYDNDMIFPLKTIEFEGYEFFAPNDCHRYLTEKYGDYMGFPKNGVLHHHGGSGDNITENSTRKGVDMDVFLEEIKQYKVN
ncbi:MAG: LicD family protein [Clostridia bacterium]|nr:LicD family protein [Clostridia bacterium]